jgi:hypothetical protein
MPLPPQRIEDVERGIGIGRVLHVDAHEEAVGIGWLENPAHVVDRGGLVDVEPELRQLERDVALDPGRDDPADDLDVVGGGGRCGGGARHAFAEVVERQAQALARQVGDRRNRFLDGFTGDEAAREALRRHPVLRSEALERGNLCQSVEQRF